MKPLINASEYGHSEKARVDVSTRACKTLRLRFRKVAEEGRRQENGRDTRSDATGIIAGRG